MLSNSNMYFHEVVVSNLALINVQDNDDIFALELNPVKWFKWPNNLSNDFIDYQLKWGKVWCIFLPRSSNFPTIMKNGVSVFTSHTKQKIFCNHVQQTMSYITGKLTSHGGGFPNLGLFSQLFFPCWVSRVGCPNKTWLCNPAGFRHITKSYVKQNIFCKPLVCEQGALKHAQVSWDIWAHNSVHTEHCPGLLYLISALRELRMHSRTDLTPVEAGPFRRMVYTSANPHLPALLFTASWWNCMVLA